MAWSSHLAMYGNGSTTGINGTITCILLIPIRKDRPVLLLLRTASTLHSSSAVWCEVANGVSALDTAARLIEVDLITGPLLIDSDFGVPAHNDAGLRRLESSSRFCQTSPHAPLIPSASISLKIFALLMPMSPLLTR